MPHKKNSNPAPDKPDQKDAILPLVLFIIIATCSFLIYGTLKQKELSYAHSMAKEEATKIELLLDAQIKEKLLALQRMAQRWQVAEGTPFKVWQSDAANYTGQLSGLKAVEWVDSTYHVRWSEPLKGNEKAIGLDIRFDEKRARALKGAADRDTPTMTPPLDLVQGYRALITYLPLRVHGTFDGFMVGIFSLEDFFGGITSQAIGNNYAFTMTYQGKEYFNNGAVPTLDSAGWGIQKPVRIYDQQWNLNITPTEKFVASQQTFLPATILITGLIIALLSAIAYHSVEKIRRNSRKLQESELRHQQLVDSVQDYAIYWLDTKGCVASWNSGARNIKQYSHDEIIGRNFSCFYTDEDQKNGLPKKALDMALAHGVYKDEGWRIRKDGSKFWASVSISPVYDFYGKHTGFSKVTRDITERKEIENALRESEERHDLAVRGMSVGLWDWKMTNGEMYWSEKLNQIFGISDPDFKPSLEYFSEHLHPDDKEATLRMLNAHLEHSGVYNAEYRMRQPDGRYVWVNAAGQAQWDADGKPVRMVGSVIDIDNRKRAEEDGKKLTAIIEMSSDFIGMCDMHETIQYLNRSAFDMIGLPPGHDVTKMKVSDFHPQWATDIVLKQAFPSLRETGVWRGETALLHRDGHEIPVMQSITLHRNAQGEPSYLTSVMQDLTERNEHERLKRDFISMVIHELRTPLTAIQGSLGLLKFMEKDLSAKSTDLLNIAAQNSNRLILLINDMLDIDKIAAGQMKFNIEEKVLAPLIRQGIEVNQPYADKFGVSIVASPISETLKVKVDPARLFQVFANLLSNAAKYSKHGDAVEITAAPFGANIRILIKDHGTGIPEEFRTRIFGKFTQAASPGDRSKGGTGLGLHICKQIIEQMGGSIGFDTEIGKGTTFWFELPVA